MTRRSIALDDRLYQYLLDVSLREPEVLARLRQETEDHVGDAEMQIGPEQGQFMGLLIELLGARRVLEIGTFTGYSALVMARAMGSQGRVVTCDVNEDTTAIARRYWREAGVDDRIQSRIGPALETLDALLEEGYGETFDAAFIDADKGNYDGYYERSLKLLRAGGLIMVDNVLWGGSVADPTRTDAGTQAIRDLNAKLHDDERVSLSLVPIGDGLTLARKR